MLSGMTVEERGPGEPTGEPADESRTERIEAAVQRADEDAANEPVTPRMVFRWAVAGSLGVLAVYLGYRAVLQVANVMVQVLIAAFIAVSLDPAVRWLIRHRLKRGQAVALIFVALLALVVVFMWALLPSLIHQGTSLTSDFPGYLDRLRDRSPSLLSLEDRFHLQARIHDLAKSVPSALGHQALSFSQRFLGALLSTVLVLVLTIYFMADLPRLRRSFVRLFPKRRRRVVDDVVNVVVDKVGSYMIGNLLVSAVAGTAALVALLALDIPFALPLAVWVAVADLIPMVGATIGAGVCVIVALATGDLWPRAVLLILFFVVYQQVENYLVVPRVMRNSVQMPAVEVLLAALLGGSVLGLVGALMAIPIAAALRVVATPMIRARDAEPVEPETTLHSDG
jgi:predicted PurR-regulated permease PerM